MKLGEIYHTVKDKGIGFTRLAKWYDEVEKSGFKSFGVVSRSIQNNYQNILNFFDNRNTNASAESFNAKIKAFRSCFIGRSLENKTNMKNERRIAIFIPKMINAKPTIGIVTSSLHQ